MPLLSGFQVHMAVAGRDTVDALVRMLMLRNTDTSAEVSVMGRDATTTCC